MKKQLAERLNGYGILLRFITPLLLGILLFMFQQLWSKVDKISDNMLLKCDYNTDLEHTRKCLERLEDRLNNIYVMKGN